MLLCMISWHHRIIIVIKLKALQLIQLNKLASLIYYNLYSLYHKTKIMIVVCYDSNHLAFCRLEVVFCVTKVKSRFYPLIHYMFFCSAIVGKYFYATNTICQLLCRNSCFNCLFSSCSCLIFCIAIGWGKSTILRISSIILLTSVQLIGSFGFM